VDPRGFPTSLPEFQRVFPNDGACAAYLERLRWPDGFACPKCETRGEPYRFPKRSSVVLRCRDCQANISLTAGTVMHRSHTPISTWFWGAYLVTTQTPGQSALQFQRQLGIGRYETAFQILHKLRAGMVRPDRDRIGGPHAVEIDETLVGGRTRGEGRGVHHKALVIGAVEIRHGSKATKHEHSYARPKRGKTFAGRLRLRVVSERDKKTLDAFVTDNVERGTTVTTDGWQGYDNLKALGYDHEQLTLGGNPTAVEVALPMIHIVFSNLKSWLRGTHHGVSLSHLQAYLNEYVFRFNRRFYPMTAFNSVLGLAARAAPPTYDELYSGEWVHPAP
jgi:transposase-like protein